ncbi:MAG: urease subunit gamma [Thermoproteota archaeon]|jgi:urease subunit gamma|nr:urease subunit gamma [Thermoproteota archaeon]
MIYVKVTVKGEPDTAPFRHGFFYADKSDEELFYNSANVVKEKLDKNLKININEALVFYCAYVIGKLRDDEAINVIQRSAQNILAPEKVMIGVPESLRKIVFEVKIDKLPKRRVILKEPITTSNYILAAESCRCNRTEHS